MLSLGFAFAAFFANLVIMSWSLGLVSTGVVLRWGLGAESFAWLIVFVFLPLCCVYYPVATLPAWLQPVALALPPTYVFEGLRAIVLDGTFRRRPDAQGAGAQRRLLRRRLCGLRLPAAERAGQRHAWCRWASKRRPQENDTVSSRINDGLWAWKQPDNNNRMIALQSGKPERNGRCHRARLLRVLLVPHHHARGAHRPDRPWRNPPWGNWDWFLYDFPACRSISPCPRTRTSIMTACTR